MRSMSGFSNGCSSIQARTQGSNAFPGQPAFSEGAPNFPPRTDFTSLHTMDDPMLNLPCIADGSQLRAGFASSHTMDDPMLNLPYMAHDLQLRAGFSTSHTMDDPMLNFPRTDFRPGFPPVAFVAPFADGGSPGA